MTEQNPGRPNGADRKPWESKISPKTPHADLVDPSTVSICTVMAEDVINNAKELAPQVNWTEVLWSYTYSDRHGRGYIVRPEIEKTFARNLRPVAQQMGWGMDSPEVVYMSGLYFCRAIDGITADKSKKIKEARDPERKFVPEEIRASTIVKREEEIEKFKSFKAVIEDSLRRYAGQKLTPGWRNYVKDLQKLFNALVSGKQEEIDEAARTLSAYPERRTRVNKKSKQKNIEKNPVVQQPIPQEKAITLFVANPQPIT